MTAVSAGENQADTPHAFDLRAARELVRHSGPERIGFAALYALITLFVLPWPPVAAWILAVVAWEAFNTRLLDWIVAKLPRDRAINAFAVSNVIGSSVFYCVALMSLSTGSPMGVAIGATWLAGAFMNNFVYFGHHPRLLWSCLVPGIVAAVVGPMLTHGPTLTTTVTSALLLTALAAAGRFSLDHRVLLRRLAERQSNLAHVERKLSIAVEASGDGLFEADFLSGKVEVSASWLAMLGRADPPSAIPDLLALAHPEDQAALQAEYAAHFRGETPHTTSELRMLCGDGRYKWVLSRARLVARAPDGAPWKLIGTLVDITARKALEHDLAAARDLAEQANAAKGLFIANMSHEIRTPLNGVIGVAGVLARSALTHQQREMVGLVQSSAQVLERMLSDILDQSKLEAGEFELQVAPFDLREVIQAAAALMSPSAKAKGLDFTVAFAEAAEGMFQQDAVRLQQVVTNLVSNAVKFTETGAVRVSVDADAPADGEPVTVVIKVSDTGVGYGPDVADRLFARFVQADDSISRRFGGTGLGLSIAKALVELMG
ncbi:MAG TPA: ATP-binding protein, partial [Caulobacter sp.]|nr:ATP-binding protein [Caulobacter sp.]